MDMAVDMGMPLIISVPFRQRVMTQADMSALIRNMHHFIRFLKTAHSRGIVQQLLIMISDHQIFASLQLAQIPFLPLLVPAGEISQDVYVILTAYSLVPQPDQGVVHLIRICKRPVVKFNDRTVSEMQICCIKYHFLSPHICIVCFTSRGS